MRYLKIVLGLALVAGLMAVVASPAMAAQPKWVFCNEVTSGKWTNSGCTTSGSGKFETAAVTETVEDTSSGKLELEDSKATGGATAITCEGTNTGTAGANGSDGIKTITATHCTFVKAGSCEEAKGVTAIARNLPWATKLEEVENEKTKKMEVRDSVTSLVAGKTPGWAVECTVAGILKITDTCEGNTSTSATANRTEGTIETNFDEVSEKSPATCSVGGAGAGFVRGPVRVRSRRFILWILALVLGTA
jgi:hypothetical protein